MKGRPGCFPKRKIKRSNGECSHTDDDPPNRRFCLLRTKVFSVQCNAMHWDLLLLDRAQS